MIRKAIALAALVLASPVAAGVHEATDAGFVVREAVDVPASPDQAWAMLLSPAKWWSKDHSFSGDPANFTLEARAGGCFCELLRNEISPNAAPRGSVEHMRVIYVEAPRALRMSGALGPLQSSAATGTLTILLRPEGVGTRIMWEYVVGGYMRADPRTVAVAVDGVLADLVERLAAQLGATPSATAPAAAPQSQLEGATGAQEAEGKSEFELEMEAALQEAEARDRPSQAPAPANSGIPPRDTQQPVFIGR